MTGPGHHELSFGSDLIVSLLAEAGVDHAAFNPGASFRGIHDSLVHASRSSEEHGRGSTPALVPCLHEAVSVAAAQGYAKVTGRPMAVLLHDVVGLQNASMAVYNAWCDRVPMLLLGGTGPLSKVRRRPWIDWIHTASVQAEVVRHAVKWDDQPHDLASVPESFARGLRTTTSEPAGPVYLCYDVDIQEQRVPDGLTVRALDWFPEPTPPNLSAQDARFLADQLMKAERPALIAGYCGDRDEGFDALAGLAELLGAAVVDTGSRCNLPSAHDCNVTGIAGALDDADVIVVLDVDDPEGTLSPHRSDRRPGNPRVFHVGLGHLRARGWSHDYQAFPRAEHYVTASAASAAVALLAEVRAAADADRVQRWAARRARLAERTQHARQRWRQAALSRIATHHVPLDRLIAEIGTALDSAGAPYVLANGTNDRLEHRLWDLNAPRQHCGWHAGGGLGYGLGAATGVAIGAGPGVIAVNVQADGDALYTPGALWTMAHLSLPVLTVVHNNRQYGNSVEHAHRLATARDRPVDRIGAGTSLTDPTVDLAGLARSFGVWATGPVSDVDRLGEVLGEALSVVSAGRPALVDVLTPPFEP